MIIKTKVSFKEYMKLIYGLAYEKTLFRLLVTVATAMLLWIICYYLNIFNLPKPVIYQYITLVLIAVVQPLFIFITVRRNYYSSNHLQEALLMELTPKEIKITGESYYMEVKWEKMFKIVEKPNWFMMYQNSLSAIIIPKKSMQEDEIFQLRKIFKNIENVPVEL